MNDADLKQQILLRLIYGEVFAHPLSLSEVCALVPGTETEIEAALSTLERAELIQKTDGYYFIFDLKNKLERRNSGNAKANALLPKAWKVGRKIYRFPYVEAVGISGSLSKGVLHEDGDFDFFIITRPNRLWVARTCLILYKKLFLLNSRKHFCVNYFIDTDHLEIEEKNTFTATEIATLLPVAGEAMQTFFAQNKWIENHGSCNEREVHFSTVSKPLMSHMVTGMLNGRLGEWADRVCMRTTLRRWKSKFNGFEQETFELTMRSRRYISKHHPNNFQNKVLTRLEEIRQEYVLKHQAKLYEEGIQL